MTRQEDGYGEEPSTMIQMSRRWPCIVITVAVLLGRVTSRSAIADPPALASPSQDSGALGGVADQSLSASEYVSLGMPSYDHEWSGQDMGAAAAKLGALASQSPEKLPRFNSGRSGQMFARIVSTDNFAFFRSHTLPLAARFPAALDYVDGVNSILKVYLSARGDNKVSGDDIVELCGAQLRGVQVELELVDEFLPTLSKDDPKYPVRMAGLDKMRGGLAELVSGTITMLTEKQNYDVTARGKLLKYCRETYPKIVPKLTAASQQELMRRLDDLAGDDSVGDLRSGTVWLRNDVRVAVRANR